MPEEDDWERHWERYAASASRNPAQRLRHELVAGLLRPRAAAAVLRILDLGSGQGDLAARLRTLFPRAELLGLELSASGVALSRDKVPGARFVMADLFHPPAELQTCLGWATDAVCSEVLEHVDSPTAFLEAARPYLAPDCRLIVTVPGGPMSAFDRQIGHRRHFTREAISRELHEAGFAVEQVYLGGFPFFNLYRAIVIARGRALAADVDALQRGGTSRLADVVMAVFRGLFRFTLRDSPWGWQVVAVARKAERCVPAAHPKP